MSEPATLGVVWRERLFLGAWILYAGYYICRKDVGSVAGSSTSPLALWLACFGATYAVGQFLGGILADRFGGRRTALVGAGASILCTLLLTWHASGRLGLLLQSGNGLGQGLGWPSLLKLFGLWFGRRERARALGWWSSSYILGGVLATSLAMWVSVFTRAADSPGFRPAYLVSSAVLTLAAFIFWKLTRQLPELGPAHQPLQLRPWRELVSNPTLRLASGMYLFLKMTRYTLLFWLPNYLISNLGYGLHAAERTAAYFGLAGFLGPLGIGYALDRWNMERPMLLGSGMLFLLAFICLLHPMLASTGIFGVVLSISLMGILIHGADLLMSGIVVLDAVEEPLQGRAIGLVNGVGSVGQALSPLLILLFVSHLGWTRLFDLFVCFALISASICALGSRFERGSTSNPNCSVIDLPNLPL